MSLRNVLTAHLFKRDETGRTTVYPNGILGRGYVLPDAAIEERLRRFITWSMIGAVALVGLEITLESAFGKYGQWPPVAWAAVGASWGALILAYELIVLWLVKGLPPPPPSSRSPPIRWPVLASAGAAVLLAGWAVLNQLGAQTPTRGEIGGIGIEVTMENGIVKVVSPIDDAPAHKAGLLANDLVTHLDGEQIIGLTLEQAVEKMRGPINTPVKLTIVRKGKDEPIEIRIVRDVIRINPVKFRAEDDVAYIKITTFNEQTHNNLVKAVDQLKKTMGKKIKGYVIDLRNNPGGLLDQAIAVSDDFLDKGEIVLTKGRGLEETQRFNARPGDITDGKKIVLLINGGSAGASEIVAGALQDHKRATIIGTRSFGMGSLQTLIPLSADGASRLTTARFYTPSGRSIQAKGIEPDTVVEQELPDELKTNASTEKPRGKASLRGHLKGDQKEKEASGSSAYAPKEEVKDTQLKHALSLIRAGPQ